MEIYTFGTGPSNLFDDVLKQAQNELTDWHGSKLGVMEMSHRSPEYLSINDDAQEKLRQLMNIPKEFRILFMQGGATLQYSAVPLNLIGQKATANYLVNGTYGKQSFEEAKKYCQPNLVAQFHENVPQVPPIEHIDETGAYFMYVDNEPEEGLEHQGPPKHLNQPLVCDMTTSFCTKKIDWSQFGCVFSSVSSNLGTAGHCVVVVRDELLGNQHKFTPSMFDWTKTRDTNSIFNTPPCFSIYFSGLCIQHMINQGGVEHYEALSLEKSKLLYDVIDSSHGFYSCVKENRSRTSIVFKCSGKEEQFLEQAQKQGLLELRGKHGIRAGLFNGMPVEGVKKLRDFMSDFIKQ